MESDIKDKKGTESNENYKSVENDSSSSKLWQQSYDTMKNNSLKSDKDNNRNISTDILPSLTIDGCGNALMRPIDASIKKPDVPLSEGDAKLVSDLQKKLKEETDAGRFSGSVAIFKNGKPLFAEANGIADRDNNTKNTLDTEFRFASMGKMFTATAVMQLVQNHKINLNDTLDKYIPDYPNKELASKVTIDDLLSHRGGTGDIFGPEFDAHRNELKTTDDYLKLYGSRGPEFEPGSKYEYSNYGYMLLGKVIENASKQDYYDYLDEHVFEKIDMTRTGFKPEGSNVPNLSKGYTRDHEGKELDNNEIDNKDTLPLRGSPAGGGYSTVGDMMKFANNLLDNKLLDEEHRKMMTTGKLIGPEHPESKYGYGFEDRNVNGTKVFGHNGGAPGMSGELRIVPEAGYAFVVLSNMDPPTAENIADFIEERVVRK